MIRKDNSPKHKLQQRFQSLKSIRKRCILPVKGIRTFNLGSFRSLRPGSAPGPFPREVPVIAEKLNARFCFQPPHFLLGSAAARKILESCFQLLERKKCLKNCQESEFQKLLSKSLNILSERLLKALFFVLHNQIIGREKQLETQLRTYGRNLKDTQAHCESREQHQPTQLINY